MTAYNDPELQILTIDDFTPGVFAQGRGSYNRLAFGSQAPKGSACQAYRCYAKKDVGLIPFPRYNTGPGANGTIYQPSATLTAAGDLSIGGMRCVLTNQLPIPTLGDIVAYNMLAEPTLSASQNTFSLNYLATTTLFNIVNTSAYTHNNSVITGNPYPGNLDTAFFQNGSPPSPQRSVFCVDTTTLLQASFTWVTFPAWDGTHLSGSLSLLPSLSFFPTPKVWYTSGRCNFTFLGQAGNPITGYSNVSAEAVYDTDIQAMTVTNGVTFNPSYFYPELGINTGAWGTMSDGEFFFVYSGGGGVVIYGDINEPSSATKLPGIVGTGSAVGAGVETNAGLIYVTDLDGAYLWNGGNTSQKISVAVPDDQFYRSGYPGIVNVHNDVWGEWYMAANNWMWDTETGGWWQVEDPNVVNFQVHCASVSTINNFYSSDGYTTINAAGPAHLNIWGWQRSVPSHNYTWTSSAFAEAGQLVDLQWVEICASNPTSVAATVTVQPCSLNAPGYSGTTLPPPNLGVVGPPVTFTIPANAIGYRESARLGYSDYNITFRVTANNPGSATTHGAPILHDLSIGYKATRTSGGLN